MNKKLAIGVIAGVIVLVGIIATSSYSTIPSKSSNYQSSTTNTTNNTSTTPPVMPTVKGKNYTINLNDAITVSTK